MPGAGITMANTPDRVPTRLLDLTRLLSRAGHGALTGVDRVELAYLDALLERPGRCLFLIRAARRHILLDRDGARALRERISGALAWGRADLRSILSPRLSRAQRRARSDARRLALGHGRLPRLLRRHAPEGGEYYNTGHSNLDAAGLRTLAAAGFAVNVLLHDTIPLDYPQFQRPGTPERFARKLQAVAAHADRVICNSEQTQEDVLRHLAALGARPATVVAHLGFGPLADPAAATRDDAPARPYFVVLGTIEPRKNHALLLDVWELLAQDAGQAGGALPTLLILGQRGWNNEEIFARLDASPLRGRAIVERAGVSDAEVARLVAGAEAMVFPSVAEGFGLPPLEAAALGTPVLCAPLRVYREFLGDFPVYLSADDAYAWRDEILRRSRNLRDLKDRKSGAAKPAIALPAWSGHFHKVFGEAGCEQNDSGSNRA